VDESGRDAERRDARNEHGTGGAVLDDFDRRVLLRMQMIGEAFDCCIEDLCREHEADRQCSDGPPQRRGLKPQQHADDRYRGYEMSLEAVLASAGRADARKREPEPAQERLVLHRTALQVDGTKRSSMSV